MEIFDLLLKLIIFILLLYSIFFKNYFQEKGKNLATKEDIGKITTEIEKVKTEISFKNQKDSDLFFERKKGLISFYENYFLWTENALKVGDIILSHHNNPETLRERLNYIKETHSKVFRYYMRILIYIDDREFKTTVSEIYTSSLSFHNKVYSLILTLEDSSIRHKNLIEKLEKSANTGSAQLNMDEYNKIVKDRDDAFKKFNLKHNEIKADINKNQKRLIQVFKKRIFDDYSSMPPYRESLTSDT